MLKKKPKRVSIEDQPQYTSESKEVILYKRFLDNGRLVDDYLAIEPVLSAVIGRNILFHSHTAPNKTLNVTSNVINDACEIIRESSLDKLSNNHHVFRGALENFKRIGNVEEVLNNPEDYHSPYSANLKHIAIKDMFDKRLIKNIDNSKSNIKKKYKGNFESSLCVMQLTPDAVRYCIENYMNPIYSIPSILEFNNASEFENKIAWDHIYSLISSNVTNNIHVYFSVNNVRGFLIERIGTINKNISERLKFNTIPLFDFSCLLKEHYTEEDFIEYINHYLDYALGVILREYNCAVGIHNGNELNLNEHYHIQSLDISLVYIVPIMYAAYMYYGTLSQDELPRMLNRFLNKAKIKYNENSYRILESIIDGFKEVPIPYVGRDDF